MSPFLTDLARLQSHRISDPGPAGPASPTERNGISARGQTQVGGRRDDLTERSHSRQAPPVIPSLRDVQEKTVRDECPAHFDADVLSALGDCSAGEMTVRQVTTRFQRRESPPGATTSIPVGLSISPVSLLHRRQQAFLVVARHDEDFDLRPRGRRRDGIMDG